MTIGISKECLEKLRDAPDSIFEMPGRHIIIHLLEKECKELDPWMPIENAPKDKELILYYHKSLKEIGWYNQASCGYKPTYYKELPEDPR